MTEREALIDALRFGPMALMMRGWTEPMRMQLCEDMASDLLSSGWTRDRSQHLPHKQGGVS